MRTPKGRRGGGGGPSRSRSGSWLPVTVLRPDGPPDPGGLPIEEVCLEVLRTLGEAPDRSSENFPSELEEAFVATSADDVGRLLKALGRHAPDGDASNRLEDALRHAASDLGRHVVVGYDNGGDFGFAAYSRSIEYVAGSDGFPIAVRLVIEILATARPATDDGIGAVATLAPLGALGGLASIFAVAGVVREMLGQLDHEEADEFQLPVEFHIRVASADDAEFGQIVTTFIEVLDRFLIEKAPALSDAIRFTGPYVPGIFFLRQPGKGQGDTADFLAKRQMLRTASLAAGSLVGSNMKGEVLGGFDVMGQPRHLLIRANPMTRLVAEMAVDPAGPRVEDAIGKETDDPGFAVMQILNVAALDGQVLFEMRRAIDLELDGGRMSPLTIEISTPAWIGAVDHETLAHAFQEALIDQMLADVERLSRDLVGHAGSIRPRFVVPTVLGKLFEGAGEMIGELLLRCVEDRHDVLPVEIRTCRSRTPAPRPAGRSWPLLPEPVEISPELLIEGIEDSIERDDGEGEVHGLDVLVRAGPDGNARWVDVDEVEETQEAFLLGRAWIGNAQTPLVISPVSGYVHDQMELDLAALVADMGSEVERSVPEDPSPQVEDLAEALFERTLIQVCLIDYVLPEPEDVPLLASTLTDLDDDIVGTIGAVAGDDLFDPRTDYYSQASRFLVAVHGDLRTREGPKGAAAVLAQCLAWGASTLVDSEDEMADRSLVFATALAYVRACRPDCIPEAEFRGIVDECMLGVALRGDFAIDTDVPGDRVETSPETDKAREGWIAEAIGNVVRYVENEIAGRPQVPLYLAVARIASAVERFQTDNDGAGTLTRFESD